MGKYVKIHAYEIEHISDDEYILVNNLNRKRIQLNKNAFRFFFQERQVLEEEEIRKYQANDNFKILFDILTKNGFYYPEDQEPLQIVRKDMISKANPTFCFSPVADYKSVSTFGILGFPSAVNNRENQSVRNAPDVIRSVSTKVKYKIEEEHNLPVGTFSLYENRWLLKGVTIQDFGNVHIRPGESAINIAEKSAQIMRRISRYCKIPVILGGDHSITYHVIQALETDAIQILYFDAHLDNSAVIENGEIYHGNVMSAVTRLPNVHSVINIGARGFHENEPSGEISVIPASTSLGLIRDELLHCLKPAVPVYISIDMDVFDPTLMNCVYFPEPFGLSPEAFFEIIEFVVNQFPIAGCDFVEYVPSLDINKMHSHLLLYLILRTMDIMKGAQ
jgi:agmatinase